MRLMADSYIFHPARRLGLFLHLTSIGLLLLAGGVGLWQASRAEAGLPFLVFLSLPLAAGVGLPVLVYRLYALWSASYILERNGIRLRWGMRVEEIPADQVEWVRLDRRMPQPLPRLAFAWPGAVVGLRPWHDGRLLEYMADRSADLVLVATAQRVFAISPY